MWNQADESYFHHQTMKQDGLPTADPIDPGHTKAGSDDLPNPLLAGISAIPIAVEVAIGQLLLSPGQVERLAPGQVLVCSETLHNRVELRLSGRTIARGELVDVEGERGIRLLSLVADE
ncbi:MAG: FliM/FliN family flagellar motor switch protein [Bradymonadales bacterium]|nr:FliM/FliN family flagellar motor switch protein [Bradymonadales bacterium]